MPYFRWAVSIAGICKTTKMKFSIGERVSILNETGIYTIIGISGTIVKVEDEHGFDQDVSLSLVVKTKPIISGKIIIKDEDESSGIRKNRDLDRIPSIDLHFEALLDEDGRYSSYDKLNYQIKRFREFINQNLAKRKTKVLVIHGIGEGRLKSEIMTLIYKSDGYIMHDANYSPQGVGASYIEIIISEAQPI